MPEAPSEPPQLVASVSSETGCLRALHRVGERQQLGHLADRGLHRLPDPARLLDVHHEGLALGMPGRGHPLPVHHDRGLVHLAAEPDQDVGRDVRVLGVAGQHPLQRHVVLAEELGAAPRLVGDGQHPVDVRVVLLHVAEPVLDELAHARGAVDPGDHRHVVARADPAVFPEVAVEIAHLGGRIEGHRLHVGADLVLLVPLPHRHVLGVHVIAHRDIRGGEADGLAVAAHRLADPPRVPRDLVAGLDVLPHLDAAARVLEHGAGRDLLLGDGHVVLGLQHNRHIRDRVRRHVYALFSPSPHGERAG